MSIDKISIIVVTYNPNIIELEENLKSYITQVPLVVIVDNSESIVIQEQIKNNFKEYINIHIITLGDNYGIGKAQNIGFEYAIEQGYEYFIEMDQDSALPDNYVLSIYNSFKNLEDNGIKIAGIGPTAFNKKNGSMYRQKEFSTNIISSNIIEVEQTLSSGFLISKKSILNIGLKDEKLFIDLVDFEWCWRARNKGYRIFVDTALRIPHLLGDGHKGFIFFKLGIPSPIRHYYQYRNALLLNKLSYVPLNWKIERTLIHLFKPIFFLLFYNKKSERAKYIFKGIKDGILGKSGKINFLEKNQ